MEQAETGKKKTYKIQLDVDVNAVLSGFDSAKSPARAHRKLMKNFSSVLLIGPPASDDLLEMMAHLFTDDEADIAQHLLPLLPLTAQQLSRRCGRPLGDVEAILENLAGNKRVIASFGKPQRYTILPLVPGLFEMIIVSPDLARNNRWHKRFAELFEKVFDSAYIKDYIGKAPALIRYLPNQGSLSSLQAAWPTDMLEELLDPYDVFGITHCQCRVVTQLAERGCGKPTDNCVAIGPLAQPLIDKGYYRKADKQEVIEAKRIAERDGCITWMMNVQNSKEGNISCSCCGCCCHALRSITQFSSPGLISAPHFRPDRDDDACIHCGKCSLVCPMGAWKKVGGGAVYYEPQRCIGCGLCVTSCEQNALALKPAAAAKRPEKNPNILSLKALPAFAAIAFKAWLRRTAGI